MDIRRRRARNALAGACLVLCALAVGFLDVQLVRSPVYAVEASGHRAHAVTVAAARGVILDRHGTPLARDGAGYTLSLLPVPADTARVTLIRLAPHLGLAAEQVAELASSPRAARPAPRVIAHDVPIELVAFIEEHQGLFPGVLVEARPVRTYPGGAAAAHLIAGVEERYDRRLTGRDGLRFIEIDPVGRLVRQLPHRLTLAPSAGEAVALNIDLRLQREVARLIPDGVAAGVVALAPATGAILVLYSSPSFDPYDPPPDRPADRAMGTAFRAGDIWQVVTAATALRYGIVDPAATLPLPCRGGMRYDARYLPCRDRRGHGALDLAGALRHSCDVYFYQLGLKIGLDRLVAEGTRLGFGAPTGIDLPGERAGSFPPGTWRSDDPVAATRDLLGMRLAAGDAPIEVSALRMALVFANVAGPDQTPAPRVVAGATEPTGPPTAPDPLLDADARERLRDGLRRSGRPAGSGLAQTNGIDWGGKMSVADTAADGPDWFVGIAGRPGGAAEIVVAVVIVDRSADVDAAAVARQVAEVHLLQPHAPGSRGIGTPD